MLQHLYFLFNVGQLRFNKGEQQDALQVLQYAIEGCDQL